MTTAKSAKAAKPVKPANIKVGNKLPAFNLEATGDQKIKLADLAGKKVGLWVYPRAATPG